MERLALRERFLDEVQQNVGFATGAGQLGLDGEKQIYVYIH